MRRAPVDCDPPGTPLPGAAIRLLGDFAVRIGAAQRSVELWPSLRSAHLVQLLSLQPQRRLAREQIIDALWPRLGAEAGAANLRKAIHHARQALGRREAVLVRAGEVALWPDAPVHIDASDFERLARAAVHGRDAAACAEAASAYAGELLPASRYEPWTEPARERLAALHLEVLRGAGDWETLARLQPTDEPAHRALIQRELEAGNRAAALRWYARLREALQESLGVAPDRQTEALYERCLAGLRRAEPAFVGRALVLAQAMSWLGLPPDERPGGIALRGLPGIGKTALGREIASLARARGKRVVSVQPRDPGRTYAAVAAVAERVLGDDRTLLDRIDEAARRVLGLLVPAAAPAQPLPGPLGRHQVVGTIRRLLDAWAGGADVLLHVDDAHRAEEADVDVLTQLAMVGPSICLLLGLRTPTESTPLTRGIARLQRAGKMQVLALEPLDDDECRRLVLRAAIEPLSAEAVSHVVAASGGHPFAAIELARSANAVRGDGLPANVAEAVLDRLCDVPGETLELLRWLAISGDAFELARVELLAAAQRIPAIDALDATLEQGVLVPADGRYRFAHELIRQALIGQIAPHRRAGMHRRIAKLLAEHNAAPAEVARHWLDGGKTAEAVPWLLAAARDALRLAAFGDALRHLEPLLSAEPGHAEALRLRAESLDALGQPAALAAYRVAAEAPGQASPDDLLAKCALAQVKQGDPKGALDVLAGLQPTSTEGRLCEALAYSGAAALGVTDPAIGTAKAAAARRLALQSGDTAAIVVASWAQAAAAHARGELHGSVWSDLRETSHLPHLAVRVFDGHLCITQRFLYGARPYVEVIAFADALAAQARRLGAARGHAFGTTLRGEAEWLSGDLASARQHLHEGARLHRAIGGAVGEALSLQRLAELSLHEEHTAEARALIDEALDLARQTDIGFHLLDRIYGTRIAIHAHDPEAGLHAVLDAEACVRGPLETCPGCRITFVVPAAIAAARAGDLDRAGEYETRCAYLADVVMRLPAWYAAHDEVRGHIAAAAAVRSPEAAARFHAAAVRFREAGHPIDAARCERLAASAGSRLARR